ncbi:hypothetical protein NP233_g5203 [Leucocoprinus birnbaumii]|uniref:Uncharacterized protein n=1 Tax=Leucocoprinus birnbaumii TaxID=56174 RepID=A0AAD5VWY7_9AGAR|nr:hypothetical protein NP233_g5203 [Leucocoprinus birnbaumii]
MPKSSSTLCTLSVSPTSTARPFAYLGYLHLLKCLALSRYPDPFPDWLRKHILIALRQLAENSMLYPQSYVLRDIISGSQPEACGGFCDIYKGTWRQHGQPLCLKVVRLYEKSDINQMFKLCAREAIVWGNLRHPNIIPFYGIYYLDSAKKRVCLVAPWQESGNIVTYLKKNPDTPRKQCCYDIANGLHYLHTQNIIHGDLKGLNVLIAATGTAYITDFGLSVIRSSKTLGATASKSIALGRTERWASPELIEEESRATKASDVWAFGCVCFEVLTRSLPFPGCANDIQVVRKVFLGELPAQLGEYEPSPTSPDGIDESMKTLISWCWSFEPKERPDGVQILESLKQQGFATLQSISEDSTEVPNRQRFQDFMRHHSDDIPDLSVVQAVFMECGLLERVPSASQNKIGSAEALLKYNSSIVFASGEHCDLDLLSGSRSLIHTGNLFFQVEHNDWVELFVLLLDNYLVFTEVKLRNSVSEHHVAQPPLLIDLISAVAFNLPPITRSTTILGNPDIPDLLYPFKISYTGRLAKPYVLYAKSAQSLMEWQAALKNALKLRNLVTESNEVLGVGTSIQEIPLIVESNVANTSNGSLPSRDERVTRSAPFVRKPIDLTHPAVGVTEEGSEPTEEDLEPTGDDHRPIPLPLQYELLLKDNMHNSVKGHEDHADIPNVIDAIESVGKETEPGVQDAKTKVELWRYNANLVFKNGETQFQDMDLLDEKRQLVHSGKLWRQPDNGFEWSGWSEMFVLLFDNYLVVTKPLKEKDGVIKYNVHKRPIPLDLLTLVNFTDPPTQRGAGLLRGLRGGKKADKNEALGSSASPDTEIDSRFVYPMTLHHSGRAGGPFMMYAKTSQSRSEWQQKFAYALAMHKAVQESNKVFEIEILNADTFLAPSMITAASGLARNQDNAFTGKVTCSVPFNASDGRRLVAVGCAEGLWIGFRHDPRSLRRVLHLRPWLRNGAMLEEFGIFLVLADKSLFAYHIEALVPSSPHLAQQNVPQKLNGNRDVHFFSVGTLHGRTLIVFAKKNSESIFRVLEPVGDKINERVKAPVGLGSRLGFRSTKSEWFRVYRDFFLPSESYDLIFLKARIAILCAKGFEIMDLNDFNSVTIPQREDPRLSHLAKRCESCRPMGMFRSSDDEFLLCYDEFGVYVDKHGDPSRAAGTIEWEGTAERVALHHPYILLFDSRFIEVRHIETGRLAQIIPGNDIRCIWDGRGVSSNLSIPATISQDMGQEAQVHAVMTSSDQGAINSVRSKAIAQCVFELIPTVPLYPPVPPSKSENQPPVPVNMNANGNYYPVPPAGPVPMGVPPTHYVHPSNSWRS